MRIIFNVMNVGLGNNGGSHTLVQSANVLKDMNHDVLFISNGNSLYTWDEIKVPHIKINDINQIDGDVIIATGMKSLCTTNKSKIENKFHWIRGWETWSVNEICLVQMLKDSPTKKIVNSICLQNKLKKHGLDSTIVRPGYDFDKLYPMNNRGKKQKIILGGLYNQGSKRAHKRTNWIFDSFDKLKKDFQVDLKMFGSDGVPKNISKFTRNPNNQNKNEIYNEIDIWLSPSDLEGLHIPPAEAMLTECCVIGNNSEMSGTQDYLIHSQTGFVTNNNFESFLDGIKTLIQQSDLRLKFGKQGRNGVLNLGDRKTNMQKLLTVLEQK